MGKDSRKDVGLKERDSLLPLIESYIRYFAAGNSHTSRAKRLDINHFLKFLLSYRGLSSKEKLTLQDCDFSAVQKFIEERLIMNEAPSTVARRLATIKHMGKILSEQVQGFVNPARGIKPPRTGLAKPKGLNSLEARAITGHALERYSRKESFIRFRNRVIFEVILSTGLRADEVRLLKMSQIDDALEWIQKVRTKGRQYRNVYINSDLRKLLKEYFVLREKEILKVVSAPKSAFKNRLPVFVSTYGAKTGEPDSFLMGAKTLYRAVNEISKATHLHPHLLRHSFALNLLDSSRDIRLVSQALGHSDVRITMRYTERREEEIASALENMATANKKSKH
jgi:integrase/recombinase XerC